MGLQELKRKEAERQAQAQENGEERPAAAPPAEAAPAGAPTAILRRPAEPPRTLAAVAAANADPPSAAEVQRRVSLVTCHADLPVGALLRFQGVAAVPCF